MRILDQLLRCRGGQCRLNTRGLQAFWLETEAGEFDCRVLELQGPWQFISAGGGTSDEHRATRNCQQSVDWPDCGYLAGFDRLELIRGNHTAGEVAAFTAQQL